MNSVFFAPCSVVQCSASDLVSEDAYLLLELLQLALALLLRERCTLQPLLQPRNVVLAELHDHAVGLDELLLLGPGPLQLGQLLLQHLGRKAIITAVLELCTKNKSHWVSMQAF